MSAARPINLFRYTRRLARRDRRRPSAELTLLCRVSRTLGWLLTGRQQMLCSILHVHGWYRLAAITDLICYQREGMSFHCARMAEMDARLEPIERRRLARTPTSARPRRIGTGGGKPRGFPTLPPGNIRLPPPPEAAVVVCDDAGPGMFAGRRRG